MNENQTIIEFDSYPTKKNISIFSLGMIVFFLFENSFIIVEFICGEMIYIWDRKMSFRSKYVVNIVLCIYWVLKFIDTYGLLKKVLSIC